MEIVNFLTSFAKDNGAISVIVLVLTVVITNLIKQPIKKHAEIIAGLAQKSGFKVTEKLITSSIVYIPFGVALVLFCIAELIGLLQGGRFDFVTIMAKTPLIAMASIGLYSVVTNTVNKAAEKIEFKEFKKTLKTDDDTKASENSDLPLE